MTSNSSTPTEKKNQDFRWIASTYFGEGLPYFVVHNLSTQLLTSLDVSLPLIGRTALLGLAGNLKALWSPWVDAYGTSKRWIVGTELAIALACACMILPVQFGSIKAMAIVFSVIAILSATHDIAVDGYYIDALDKTAQARYSGLRVGAFRAAGFFTSGFLVTLAGWTNWSISFSVGAFAVAGLAAFHALTLRKNSLKSTTHGVQYRSTLRSFLNRPFIATILAFILFYRAGDAMMFSMSTPLLKHLGVTTAQRGIVSGVLGTAASIFGATIGGLWISKVGLHRCIRTIATIQSSAILLYVWMASGPHSLSTIAAIVVLEQIAAGIGTAALMVFLMRICVGEYRASHFAIGSALMSVATTLFGTVSGDIADRIGYFQFFTLAFLASLPGVVVAYRIPRILHTIDQV